MATTTERRVIVVDVKGSSAAVKDLKALQKHAASTDKNIARMGKTLGNIGFTIKAFIAYRLTSYIAGIGPAFINAADSVLLMQSRLGLVNKELGNTTALMGELFDVADDSRGSIDAVATLYTRLAASTKNLNVTQSQLLDFTELVSDTFVLSGSSAGEAASGITQISQAMAKGKLDGDEFKSIMENNVYFGGLLAKTLGVTRGELLKLSKDGKITSDVLLSMAGNIDEVRAQMSEMPVTADQAGTAWGNAFSKMIANGTTLQYIMTNINKGSKRLANAFGDSFDDNPIKQAQEAIEDQIEVVEELQNRVNEMTPILGEHMDMWDRISQSLAPKAFERAAGVARGDLLEANKQLKEMRLNLFNLEQDAAFERGELGPEQELPGPPADTTVFDKWVESVMKADKEASLFLPKLQKLDDLLFQDKISESVYAKELEKLTGSLSDSGKELSRFDQLVAAQKEVNSLIEASKDPFDQFIDQMDRMEEIAFRFPELADKVVEAQEAFWEAQGDDAATEQSWIDWGKTAETAIGGITGSLIDMAITGENSFADFARSFLINIAKMIAQQAVLNTLQSSPFGSFLGLKAANGAVFDQGNVVPFATGGIVNSPTLFPMANGGTGLMGEAGPEAIMPLKRGEDGKLGVAVSGSGGGVIQNINVQGNGDAALEDAVRRGAREGYAMALNDVQRNGPLRRGLGV